MEAAEDVELPVLLLGLHLTWPFPFSFWRQTKPEIEKRAPRSPEPETEMVALPARLAPNPTGNGIDGAVTMRSAILLGAKRPETEMIAPLSLSGPDIE